MSQIKTKKQAVQPRAAAGVVLLRQGSGGPEVLLGRRNARLRFMPGVYVFPGGRLDPADHQPSGFAEPSEHGPHGKLDLATRRLLPALRRAALREVWEETGLLVAQPGALAAGQVQAPRPGPPLWQRYGELDSQPAFKALHLLARAITPRRLPTRYHTRFFICHTEGVELHGQIGGDGELEDLGWRPVDALARLPMADVTQAVLKEAVDRLRTPAEGPCLFLYRRDSICRR